MLALNQQGRKTVGPPVDTGMSIGSVQVQEEVRLLSPLKSAFV
jgi:hypothetical protein